MKKIVIYGSGRSGTTLLGNFLAAHPAINWDGEVLNQTYWQSQPARLAHRFICRYPSAYLQWCATRSVKPAYAMKLLTYQSTRLRQTIAQLHRWQWQIIYLYRRSLFDRLLSAEVAKLTKRWHSTDSSKVEKVETVTIPLAYFLEKLKYSYRVCEEELATVASVPHLTLCYEDALSDSAAWTQTIQQVLDYIGLALIPAQAKTTTTWAQSYAALVTNYQELLTAAQAEHLYYHALYNRTEGEGG